MESSEKEFQQLVAKREKEIKAQVEAKVHKFKTGYVAFELILSLIGFGIITYTGGWLMGVGVFFAMWGNNMMLGRKNWK